MTKLWPLVLITLLALPPLFAQPDQAKPTSVLSTLKVGQSINVKDVGDRYLVTVIDGDLTIAQPHTVLEVGSDYLVVKDFTGFSETRIPLTSIKAVAQFKGLDRRK